MDTIGQATKTIFGTSAGWQNVLLIVLGLVLAALFTWVLARLTKAGNLSILFFRERVQTPRALRSYREGQEKATLALTHSWKLEGQSLERLIVPLHLEVRTNERIGLEQWVSESFAKPGDVPRLVLLGEAGSGKSVAMGTIARALWKVNLAKPLVPVLLTFKEIQNVRDEQALCSLVVRKFQQFQYDRGREGSALKFAESNLNSGGIVLLLDGLDELEKQARLDVAGFLRQFFTTYPEVAFVVSSRVAVWNQFPSILGDLEFSKYTLAPFTPLEVKIFVSRWEFSGEKSADQLSQLIISKPYLLNMAENPLILTIICFLYAQPKRVLPDHRVKFYSECVDALMEKWDNAKNVDRANQFETVDKVAMLSAVAYRHLAGNAHGNEDIQRAEVLDVIGVVMRKLSRPVEKRQLVLDEIVQKAELLVEIPPDQLKFPHRTFLEYFAALYFYKNHLHLELLDLYHADPGKWQETLLLYCGMNENLEVSDLVFGRLIERYRRDSAEVMVFKALVETAMVSGGVANAVVDLAEGHLAQEIHAEIVECLGYVAANGNWRHGGRAREVLFGLLERDLDSGDLVAVCFAVLGLGNSTLMDEAVKKLKRLDLAAVVRQMAIIDAKKAGKLVESVLDEDLPFVLNGLLGAGEVNLVFELACFGKKKAVRNAAVMGIVQQPRSEVFWELLEKVTFADHVDSPFLSEVDQFHQRYKWPNRVKEPQKDVSFQGQRAFFAFCHVLADLMKDGQVIDSTMIAVLKEGANNQVLYIVSAILHGLGQSFHRCNLFGKKIYASRKGLEATWKYRFKNLVSFPIMKFGIVINVLLDLLILWRAIRLFPLPDIDNTNTLIIYFLGSILTVMSIVLFFDKIMPKEKGDWTMAIITGCLVPYPLIYGLTIEVIDDKFEEARPAYLLGLIFACVHLIFVFFFCGGFLLTLTFTMFVSFETAAFLTTRLVMGTMLFPSYFLQQRLNE